MFSWNISTLTEFIALVSVVVTFREQTFDVTIGKRIANTAHTQNVGSVTECAMLCMASSSCCSASYYYGVCRLNSNCYPITETFVNSYVLQKRFHGDCKTDELGLTYSGIINTTITGRACQIWALDVPHIHEFHSQDSNFNYCRNPDTDYPGPWCYTTDSDYRWDFCPVYECGTNCGHGWFRCNSGQCILDHWRCNGISDCPSSEDESNCDDVPACLEDDVGFTYRGKINVTWSGIPCQHWSSQSPNSHSNWFLSAENYCRNYESDHSSPWCYTLNTAVRWDYCDIPDCV